MDNEIIFNQTETIKITVYRNNQYDCPIFTVENSNKDSSLTEIIEDTLKLY